MKQENENAPEYSKSGRDEEENPPNHTSSRNPGLLDDQRVTEVDQKDKCCCIDWQRRGCATNLPCLRTHASATERDAGRATIHCQNDIAKILPSLLCSW